MNVLINNHLGKIYVSPKLVRDELNSHRQLPCMLVTGPTRVVTGLVKAQSTHCQTVVFLNILFHFSVFGIFFKCCYICEMIFVFVPIFAQHPSIY